MAPVTAATPTVRTAIVAATPTAVSTEEESEIEDEEDVQNQKGEGLANQSCETREGASKVRKYSSLYYEPHSSHSCYKLQHIGTPACCMFGVNRMKSHTTTMSLPRCYNNIIIPLKYYNEAD